MKPPDADDDETRCPICQTDLAEMTELAVNNHVNHCLDGDSDEPVLVSRTPTKPTKPTFTLPPTARSSNPHAPLASAPTTKNTKPSAFNKLMTTNSEAAAWAAAAKHEQESRGKRAAERTCPFYKLLYNGAIAVDAFRYGAVPGVTAYFLSHFHSDHYIGLSKTWSHGPIYCSRVTANLVRSKLGVAPEWVRELKREEWEDVPETGGVRVRGLDANHCPGSMLFLFEKAVGGGSVGSGTGGSGKVNRILHCGDFRAHPKHLAHPLLAPPLKLDTVYLDTTYLNPKYAFPSQEHVIAACAQLCVSLNTPTTAPSTTKSPFTKSASTKSAFSVTTNRTSAVAAPAAATPAAPKKRLLVVIGTYSIGKERICVGIAHALHSLIYCTPSKLRILSQLEDAELAALLTTDPAAAQVHMTSLFDLKPATLAGYLEQHRGAGGFTHVVGIRPSGWSYAPPAGRVVGDGVPVRDVLYAESWRSPYGVQQVQEVRGSGGAAIRCFTVPYSEHSSFRELAMFCCALDIAKVVPTVNVGSRKGRERMKGWVEAWARERARGGFFKLGGGEGVWS
ncbi:DNA repair metallo-beta-lactamase-domain-containing protein [Geopyxis carbonaria]|nr:DNA repair metallo-beta-lactamase-domain-containing protein [Geopyxis carbonaria]